MLEAWSLPIPSSLKLPPTSCTSSPLAWRLSWYSMSGPSSPLLVRHGHSPRPISSSHSDESSLSKNRSQRNHNFLLHLYDADYDVAYTGFWRFPPGSGSFAYLAAIQNGFTSALCTCLLINGFVGFQLYEDGTRQSVWLIRGCSAGMFLISGAVSILTFKNRAGLGPQNTIGLFVVLYLLNTICLLIYVVMQVILVANTLQDRWPLGDIAFGVFFFVVGQVILYVFSDTLCNGVSHYLDGLFFATICNLLAVMMVYKVSQSQPMRRALC